MKQAGRVRRPFQAQALVLILLCRNLVTAFADEARHTADNALVLEECVGLRVVDGRGCLLTLFF